MQSLDFQSKALSWQVNFGFEYWQTGVAVFMEFFGGIAIALGLLTRLSAFGIIAVMIVGIWVAHLDNGFYPTYDTLWLSTLFNWLSLCIAFHWRWKLFFR